MNFKLSFHGAAGTVTGSRNLLTAGHDQILIDCGLFQGLKELREMNWRRPEFTPSDIGDVFLTHAHIDHSGYLPRLARLGFHGTIHCTPATKELADVLLLDAAKLQEEDAEYSNRKGFSKHHPALPLYTEEDARHAVRRMETEPYGKWVAAGNHVRGRFHNAGHIVGSAFVEIAVDIGGREMTIVFSGDIGRYDVPLHADPEPLPACDVLVVESTYGDRPHDRTPLADQLREPFRQAFARGGTILIPAFAVARAQLLVLLLSKMMRDGDIPEVPIHIDSPMAVKATEVYRRHANSHELDEELAGVGWEEAFPKRVQFHSSVDESRKLNNLPGPRIIIAASGMMTGGRVLHHLERLLPDEKTLIVIAGYQAPGTRGRKLLEGAPALRMHGRDIPVRAQVLSLTGLSAHADGDELMRWVRSGPALPRKVFVTHGEQPSADVFAERIRNELHLDAHVPAMGEQFDLSQDFAQA